MKIAQVNNNISPVDRYATGSIASHVGALSDELVALGEEVDVYAAQGSVTTAELLAFPRPDSGLTTRQITRSMRVIVDEVLSQAGSRQYDVIQSHLWPTKERLGVWRTLSDFALVCAVLHSDPTSRQLQSIKEFPDQQFIAFSKAQSERLDLNWLGVVNHGVDTNYLSPSCTDTVDDKVAVIGKIKPSKGTHVAIKAGLASGLKVEVAGPIMNERYYQRCIAPLVDNDSVKYLGVVTGEEKRRMYAESVATVVASRAAETFCLVLAESMACGTPVVGINSTTIPEVVDEGKTGYVVESVNDLPEAIEAAAMLSRRVVRNVAVQKYSTVRMAANYRALFMSHTQSGLYLPAQHGLPPSIKNFTPMFSSALPDSST